MDNSRKSHSSSSTHISEKNHEKAISSPLPHQHPIPIISPTSSNVPTTLHTFPASITNEGARYSINSDGYIVRNTVGLNDMNRTFTKKPFILEIPNGSNVISCVVQFAQRYGLPVTVLCGNGLISEVDFTCPQSQIQPKFIYGCYQIISFSGIYNCLNAASDDIVSSFTVSLVDAQGTLMGGLVASTMKAASTVTLVVCVTNDLS